MEELRTALAGVTSACAIIFVATWLLGAIYFGLKEPHGIRTLLRSFGRPLLFRLVIAIVVIGVVAFSHVNAARILTSLMYWNPVLALIGAVVALVSTALLVWARLALGGMWASVPLVQEDHRLVTHGPYRFVRHPIYTGLLGMAFAAALTYGFGFWAVILVLAVPFILRRVYVEDRMMADTFGSEYDTYRARVPALFPSVRAVRPSRLD